MTLQMSYLTDMKSNQGDLKSLVHDLSLLCYGSSYNFKRPRIIEPVSPTMIKVSLLIVYYGGHGYPELNDKIHDKCFWAA